MEQRVVREWQCLQCLRIKVKKVLTHMCMCRRVGRGALGTLQKKGSPVDQPVPVTAFHLGYHLASLSKLYLRSDLMAAMLMLGSF